MCRVTLNVIMETSTSGCLGPRRLLSYEKNMYRKKFTFCCNFDKYKVTSCQVAGTLLSLRFDEDN
jgi:hypothetical protein